MVNLQRAALAFAGGAALTVGSVTGAASAHADDVWQSIYYSPSTGSFGFVNNFPTMADADRAARSFCIQIPHGAAPDCTLVGHSTGCVALATGDNGWSAGYGSTSSDAQNDALANNHGGHIVRAICPAGPNEPNG